MNLKFPLLIFAVLGLLTIFIASSAQAKDWLYFESINYPLLNDYTITPEDNNEISLKFLAGSTYSQLTLKMMTLVEKDNIGSFFTLPDGKTPATDLYFMNFTPISDNSFSIQPQAIIKYQPDDHYKEAYFYDWTILEFVKLESVRDEINKTLTVDLPKRQKIMIVLLNEPEIVGKASWYVHPKYENQLIAASRDFALDSKVNVYNLYNNKEVVVTIKDYGPKKCSDWTEKEQRLMGPCQDRVIDLSKTAFLKLATTTGVGILSSVKVTPIGN
ncbi:MAG: RlpA-like double-psi beta-barrel domain-containing protein [Candidatus Buchananbacteria bacterium]|nr:RlpA-like double-psi beta-barrel domain-containing protein [Candidatus Buchananbacteria bacterium]